MYASVHRSAVAITATSHALAPDCMASGTAAPLAAGALACVGTCRTHGDVQEPSSVTTDAWSLSLVTRSPSPAPGIDGGVAWVLKGFRPKSLICGAPARVLPKRRMWNSGCYARRWNSLSLSFHTRAMMTELHRCSGEDERAGTCARPPRGGRRLVGAQQASCRGAANDTSLRPVALRSAGHGLEKPV